MKLTKRLFALCLTLAFLTIHVRASQIDEWRSYIFDVSTPDRQHETLYLYTENTVTYDGKEYVSFLAARTDGSLKEFFVALRIEGVKYFCYDSDAACERLLFDFSLQRGDTFSDGFSGTEYEVVAVRDTLICDSLLQMVEIQSVTDKSKRDTWIEGIGSVHTGILPPSYSLGDARLIIYNCYYIQLTGGYKQLSAYFYPNSPSFKAGSMDVQELYEEDFEPSNLNAEFMGDTLHVWGRVLSFCDLYPYAACELRDNQATLKIYPYNISDDADCFGIYHIDARIPDFQSGRYTVSLLNKDTVLDCRAGSTPEYFPEGTKWTEVRLDTLKYNSWYSKVDGEWKPNFETIEYRVQGTITNNFWDGTFKCVYSNINESKDSLTLAIQEGGYRDGDIKHDQVVYATVPITFKWGAPAPTMMYQFDWSVGDILPYRNIIAANSTYSEQSGGWVNYGVVSEIKEGEFGGVRPLKYVDVEAGRIIQGIGITEWNDGECIFGPMGLHQALSQWGAIEPEERHYRSMLVHFERDGEVLYDRWPEKGATSEPVTFTEGQMATVILPVSPDAAKGKYYRLDRIEDGQIIFEQEKEPRARTPYIIVPAEDFSIDMSTLDLAGCYRDTASIDGIRFIGSYVREEFDYLECNYVEIIDVTPDCRLSLDGAEMPIIGALRAYLEVDWKQLGWDDPYSHGGTKVPGKGIEIVLRDRGTGIEPIQNSKFKIQNGEVYDLQGRKMSNGELAELPNGRMSAGFYIIRQADGTARKVMVK